MIQYMSILKAYTYLGMGQLSTTEQALYFRLFLVNNLSGWGEWFGADNKRLMFECNINSKQTLERAKQRLKDLGFINYIPGKKGKPTQYTLTPILKKGTFIVPYTGENTGAKTGEKTGEETGRIYRHIDKDKDNTPLVPKKGKPVVSSSHSPEFEEAWAGFVEMRKKIRKPLTDRAKDLLFKKLEKLAPGDEVKQAAILDQSIERCWQGVFELKQEKPISNHQAGGGNECQRMKIL